MLSKISHEFSCMYSMSDTPTIRSPFRYATTTTAPGLYSIGTASEHYEDIDINGQQQKVAFNGPGEHTAESDALITLANDKLAKRSDKFTGSGSAEVLKDGNFYRYMYSGSNQDLMFSYASEAGSWFRGLVTDPRSVAYKLSFTDEGELKLDLCGQISHEYRSQALGDMFAELQDGKNLEPVYSSSSLNTAETKEKLTNLFNDITQESRMFGSQKESLTHLMANYVETLTYKTEHEADTEKKLKYKNNLFDTLKLVRESKLGDETARSILSSAQAGLKEDGIKFASEDAGYAQHYVQMSKSELEGIKGTDQEKLKAAVTLIKSGLTGQGKFYGEDAITKTRDIEDFVQAFKKAADIMKVTLPANFDIKQVLTNTNGDLDLNSASSKIQDLFKTSSHVRSSDTATVVDSAPTIENDSAWFRKAEDIKTNSRDEDASDIADMVIEKHGEISTWLKAFPRATADVKQKAILNILKNTSKGKVLLKPGYINDEVANQEITAIFSLTKP